MRAGLVGRKEKRAAGCSSDNGESRIERGRKGVERRMWSVECRV
jgi:hypothetical protein